MAKKNNIIDFQSYKNARDEELENDNEQWIVRELICVKCLHRWFSLYPDDILLRELTCPHCKVLGAIIDTGQEIPDRDLLMAALDHIEEEFNIMQTKDPE